MHPNPELKLITPRGIEPPVVNGLPHYPKSFRAPSFGLIAARLVFASQKAGAWVSDDLRFHLDNGSVPFPALGPVQVRSMMNQGLLEPDGSFKHKLSRVGIAALAKHYSVGGRHVK